jgi:hypothetical protein
MKTLKGIIPISTVTVLLILLSCNSRPEGVSEALNQMKKENKAKFESVFDHYSHIQDSLKLKAAYFLVENMVGLGFYKGRQIEDYNVIFDILAAKPADYRDNLPWYSNDLVFMFDSLRAIYGPMSGENFYFVKDEDVMSAEFLINYIDQAFKSWENPWCKEVVSFHDFCNYVLPYRNFSEPLEDWRAMFTNKFSWIRDSFKNQLDIIEVAKKLNVGSELKYSNGFGSYTVSIAPSLILKAMYGDCANTSNYKAMILRAHGIPATVDFFPQYGSDHNTHYWNSVMDRNGNFVSFEEALNDINAFVAYKYKISKVFRKTFSQSKEIKKLIQEVGENIPPLFKNGNMVDVTSEYVAVSDVKIQLKDIPANTRYVYVGIFNDTGWTIIDYGKIENNKYVQFKDLGRDVLYLPLYFLNGQHVAASLPFKLSIKGNIQYLDPQKEVATVHLTRKYHMYQHKVNWLQCLIGARFEGANRQDFSDAVTLGTIDHIPGEHFCELNSRSNQSFRYVRLLFSASEANISYDGDGASIAEIEFIDGFGRKIPGAAFGTPGRKYNSYVPGNCFDGNPLSFFEDARPGVTKFVGLQFSLPVRVSKIRFLPRNDMNSIQIGDNYELLYWDNKAFQSLGRKVATDTILNFENVPHNSILWLRNHSGGKEERIFTWENGEQIWW